MYAIMIAAQNPWNSETYVYSRAYDFSSYDFLTKYFKKKTFKAFCRRHLSDIVYKRKLTYSRNEKFDAFIKPSEKLTLACFLFCKKNFPIELANACMKEALVKFEGLYGENFHWFKEDKNLDCDLVSLIQKYKEKHNTLMNSASNSAVTSPKNLLDANKANSTKYINNNNSRKLTQKVNLDKWRISK